MLFINVFSMPVDSAERPLPKKEVSSCIASEFIIPALLPTQQINFS